MSADASIRGVHSVDNARKGRGEELEPVQAVHRALGAFAPEQTRAQLDLSADLPAEQMEPAICTVSTQVGGAFFRHAVDCPLRAGAGGGSCVGMGERARGLRPVLRPRTLQESSGDA